MKRLICCAVLFSFVSSFALARDADKQTIGFSSDGFTGVNSSSGDSNLFMVNGIANVNGSPEQAVSNVAAFSGNLKNMYIISDETVNYNQPGNSATFTWRINGIDTAITCTINFPQSGSVPPQTCSDTTHTATINAGDYYDLRTSGSIVRGGSNGDFTGWVSGGIEFDLP